MKINRVQNSPNFMRRLKSSEEAEYSETLRRGKQLVSKCDNGKSMLIIPVSSLPQLPENNTGIGNLSSKEAKEFTDFVKKYWGINEFQILPVGQYFSNRGHYPIYTGSSMDLGNHVINLKKFLSDEEYKRVIEANKNCSHVNYENVVDRASASENALLRLYENMPEKIKTGFENYKTDISEIIERKSLYRALEDMYHTHRYKEWSNIDKNLFNEDIVSEDARVKRIAEIKNERSKLIDFYKFKQFLAQQSLTEAKEELNKNGIKLNGDMLCGFTFDERWSYPKAFLPDYKINWGVPALNVDSVDAENILRAKTRFYAKNFDGFRVDAAWTYAEPNLIPRNGGEVKKADYGDKFLRIIEDEVLNVKGRDYDLKNIMYEFSANSKDFNIHSEGDSLKPYVRDRVKIYTSDYLHEDWGHTENFIGRGWGNDMFILGMTNHDSPQISAKEEQVNILSRLFKMSPQKLKDSKEFFNTKIAEPLRAKNSMLFFMTALGIKGQYKDNSDNSLDFRTKINHNYQDEYFKSLKKGEAYNPMDALERNFKAMGLDKTEPDLYKKIVKYRDILAGKNCPSATKIGTVTTICGILALGVAALAIEAYHKNHKS